MLGSHLGPNLKGKHPDISEWLPDAAPMILNPGDVGMHNRNALHGSFPNRSPERRITQQMGYHRRSSVLWGGVTKSNWLLPPKITGSTTGHRREITYDEEFVTKSSRIIALAIDARRQKYPHEAPYVYQPLVGQEDQNRWNEKTREEIRSPGNEYWRHDIYM